MTSLPEPPAEGRTALPDQGGGTDDRLTVIERNGIGEEYGVEYEVLERVSDRENVRVVIGRDARTGATMVLVLTEDGRQQFASGPADQTARERALYFADGYRQGRAAS